MITKWPVKKTLRNCSTNLDKTKHCRDYWHWEECQRRQTKGRCTHKGKFGEPTMCEH